MDDEKFLAARFGAERGRLERVAYRMLGSRSDAEDAVQEAWFRLARTDRAAVDNLGGWLTTVVARICLDMLRAQRSRSEDPVDDRLEPVAAGSLGDQPERDALLADSVGVALLVVLEALAPAERIALVLHDMFDVPFDEIGPILGKTPVAARQLASRARRRVQGADSAAQADRARKRAVVAAFLAASREGDFEGLLAILAPDVVFRAEPFAARMGSKPEILGSMAVAGTFSGRAQGARVALLDGDVGIAVPIAGTVRIVIHVTLEAGRITSLEAVADPRCLAGLETELLDA